MIVLSQSKKKGNLVLSFSNFLRHLKSKRHSLYWILYTVGKQYSSARHALLESYLMQPRLFQPLYIYVQNMTICCKLLQFGRPL